MLHNTLNVKNIHTNLIWQKRNAFDSKQETQYYIKRSCLCNQIIENNIMQNADSKLTQNREP